MTAFLGRVSDQHSGVSGRLKFGEGHVIRRNEEDISLLYTLLILSNHNTDNLFIPFFFYYTKLLLWMHTWYMHREKTVICFLVEWEGQWDGLMIFFRGGECVSSRHARGWSISVFILPLLTLLLWFPLPRDNDTSASVNHCLHVIVLYLCTLSASHTASSHTTLFLLFKQEVCSFCGNEN